jgi:hypothetical protein
MIMPVVAMRPMHVPGMVVIMIVAAVGSVDVARLAVGGISGGGGGSAVGRHGGSFARS